jgi:hypothetical protein
MTDWNGYLSPGQDSMLFDRKSYTGWQHTGKDRASISPEHLFVEPAKNDFHIRPGSPALSIGFTPLDHDEAGAYDDRRWKELARSRAR